MSGQFAGRLACLVTFSLAALALAADPRVERAAEAYKRERDKAVELSAEKLLPGFPVSRADEWARRAEAVSATRPAEALRLYREARWRLPAVPEPSPPHLARLLGNPRLRHSGTIHSLAYPAEQPWLASAGDDGVVRIWDLDNGRLLRELHGTGDRIRGLAFYSKGSRLAAADGNIVTLWDITTGKEAGKLTGAGSYLTGLAVRRDDKFLAAAGDDRTVRFWDLANNREAFHLGVQNSQINAIDFSPDGRYIAVATGEGLLEAWDVESADRKKVVEQRVCTTAAYCVRFAPDGKSIAICGERAARLITMPAANSPEPVGAIRRNFEGPAGHSDLVTSVAFAPDGKSIATGSRDNSVRLWDITTGQPTRTFYGHSGEVRALAFAPKGHQLASAGDDQVVRLWDLEPSLPAATASGHRGPVWSVDFFRDSRRLVTGGADRTARLFDAASGQELRSLTGHTQPVTSVLTSPDGQTVWTASGDRTIRSWNTASGANVHTLEGHEAAVLSLARNRDGSLIVSAGADRSVRGWEAASGKGRFVWRGHRASVTAVAVQPDGRSVASGAADGVVKLWELSSGREMLSFKAHEPGGVGALAFTPDGRLVTVGGDKLVKVWDVSTGPPKEPLAQLAGHTGPVSGIAIAPDGRTAASGGADGTVKLWNLANRTEMRSYRGHSDWVAAVAFAPNGQSLASAGVDGKVQIWAVDSEAGDPAGGHSRAVRSIAAHPSGLFSSGNDRLVIQWDPTTGRQKRTFPGNPAEVIAVAVSTDGKRMLASTADRRLKLWSVANGEALQQFEPQEQSPLVAFEPDGEKFVAWQKRDGGSEDDVTSSVIRIEIQSGRSEELIAEKGNAVRCLAFVADSSLAAVGGPTGKVRVWNLTTKKLFTDELGAHTKPVADVALTPDRQWLITGDEEGEIKSWRLGQLAAPMATFKADLGRLIGFAVSPTSGRAAALGAKGEIVVFDVATGKVVRQWKLVRQVGVLAFTADGKQIAAADGDGVGSGDGTIKLFDLP